METIYNWRGRKVLSKVPLPKKKGEYLYFISFPDERTETKKLVYFRQVKRKIEYFTQSQKYNLF